MNVFDWVSDPDGVRLKLASETKRWFVTNSTNLKVSDWLSGGDSRVRRGLLALTEQLEDLSDEERNSEELFLSHSFVASISELSASALNLPSAVPYQLRVFSEGKVIDESFQLNSEFLDGDRPLFHDGREGSILRIGRVFYRIPSPMFDILEEVKSPADGRDELLEKIARISELFGVDADSASKIEPDKALSNMRIRHASGFSSSVHGEISSDPILKPILFAEHLVESTNDSGELLDEAQQILDQAQSADFSAQFALSSGIPGTFLLSSGEYVYLDPSIRGALVSFRKVCNGPPEVRKAFLKAPRAVLIELAENDVQIEEALARFFLETSQFSDRVISVQEWEAPELPFYATQSNDWGIEVVIFTSTGLDAPVVIPKDKLEIARDNLSSAISSEAATFEVDGQIISASKQLLDAINDMIPEKPSTPDSGDVLPDVIDKPVVSTFVVHTQDNFELINYIENVAPPDCSLLWRLPRALKPSTLPLQHQESGLEWLIDCFNYGLPGALMADDMGLGKTLQALLFLVSFREQTPAEKRGPILIVAPTGLLSNWQKEITDHLTHNSLGTLLLAYGAGLRSIRTGKGKDTDFGASLLDINKIGAADVVFTTYETQRDYQASFSLIKFSIVIFDEIQKVKNPKSLISRSATTLNADFKIGLSGTPVENSIADLWTILDVLSPGIINLSLKEFLIEYSGSPEEEETLIKLEQLKDALLTKTNERPPLVLRRMKDQVFKGIGPDGSKIPDKFIVPVEETSEFMPKEQEEFYSRIVNETSFKQLRMIEALHYFRRISLSPRHADELSGDSEGFIESSGRLKSAFKILDEVSNRNEKVIVFVESRDIQGPLALLIQERYKLIKSPLIINGAVSGAARQARVDEFQNGLPGFDAIIISPKAGGVGLTLTAANHVLHLERWWNPAVEDQCNDRAYRIGQKKDVKIYTPVAVHKGLGGKSFDLVLNQILTKKRHLANSLFVPAEIGADDFGSLFEGDASSIKFRPRGLQESYELESGEDFEKYVADSLHHSGFKVRSTPRSWDKGCDLTAEINGNRVLIQCKQVRRAKTLLSGVGEIIDARSSYKDCQHLALITNALSISSSEKALANEHKVILLLGDSVEDFGDKLKSKIFQ